MNTLPSSAPALTLRVLLVCCALAVVSLLYLPLPLLAQLSAQHGIGATGLLSSFGVAYACGFLVFGPLSDRLGRRTVLLGGLLALATITALLASVTTPALLVAGRILQGFAAASFPPVAIAFIAEHGSTRQRAWGVAWMSTAFLSAGLLGQIYGVAIASRIGFGNALLPLCAVYLVTAAALWRQPPVPRSATALHGFLGGYRTLGRLLADRVLRRAYVPALFLLMSFVAYYISVDRELGASLAAAGISPLALRALAAPAFLAPLAVALVITRWGTRPILCGGLTLTALSLAVSAGGSSDALGLLLGGSVLLVAGIGVSVPALIAQVASASDDGRRGMAVALYTFVLFIGASLGPAVATWGAALPLSALLSLMALVLGSCAVYAGTAPATARN